MDPVLGLNSPEKVQLFQRESVDISEWLSAIFPSRPPIIPRTLAATIADGQLLCEVRPQMGVTDGDE
jgi:hypothetical protein